MKRLALHGPHGLGKTGEAALIVWWFATTRDGEPWKAVTTASVWRQLSVYLWPEIHLWGRRIRWDLLGFPEYDLQMLHLKMTTGEAFAVASNEPAHIEGAHADHILYVFDEAKTIAGELFDAAEGAFSGAGADTGREAYALAFSTPGDTSGRFYEICAQQGLYAHWKVRHVTRAEAIQAGRMSESWAKTMADQWGEESSEYRNRVLGEFAAADEDTIIPLAWVQAAQHRWRFGSDGPFTCLGVDVADQGSDDTVFAYRHGERISQLREPGHGDTMATTGHIVSALTGRDGYVTIDSIGIGAGVVARLREVSHEADSPIRGLAVEAFNAAEGTTTTDISGELHFANKRAAAWWGLRDRLNPAHGSQIELPPDERLTGELTAPKWRMTSSGKVLVESKDEIRKRIGRSTDYADAVVMAFWETRSPARLARPRRPLPRTLSR